MKQKRMWNYLQHKTKQHSTSVNWYLLYYCMLVHDIVHDIVHEPTKLVTRKCRVIIDNRICVIQHVATHINVCNLNTLKHLRTTGSGFSSISLPIYH